MDLVKERQVSNYRVPIVTTRFQFLDFSSLHFRGISGAPFTTYLKRKLIYSTCLQEQYFEWPLFAVVVAFCNARITPEKKSSKATNISVKPPYSKTRYHIRLSSL